MDNFYLNHEEIMSENDIINKYKLGQLKDIFVSENCFYMPIRITGTGETLRVFEKKGKKDSYEFIVEDRTKHLFFTKDILDQCARLPILLQHPKNGSLLGFDNPQDLKQIIGQTIYSYIKGEEIWAIGRIYDLGLLKLINKKIFSTSPGVLSNCAIIGGNLSKETPIEINHIAFVERGHWDCKSAKAFDVDGISIREDISNQIKESILEDLVIIDNNQVKRAVVQRADSDIVEVKQPDEEVVVSHEVKPVADETSVVDNADIEVKKEDDEIIVTENEEGSDDIVDVSDDDIEVIEDNTEDLDIEENVTETIDDEEDLKVITEDEEEIVEINEYNDSIDTEIIESDEVTPDDIARDKLVDSLNEICDSAHSALNVKMPYINGRETTLSIANKFINLNKHLLDSKYHKIVNGRLDNMNADLCKDFISSIRSKIKTMSAQKGKVAMGFVETRRGYKVDSNF